MSIHSAYITLLASLPRPGPLFVEEKTPLSRTRLESRLKLLDDEDRARLDKIEQAIEWRKLSHEGEEQALITRANRALAVCQGDTLKSIILRRLEMRTAVAALRRRNSGAAAPSTNEAWGFGRWTGRIRSNWSAPLLGLEASMPWLREADELLAKNQPEALEKLLMGIAYRDLSRFSGLHEFDFEAVVIYVLKWDIVERWSRYNTEAASKRFDRLTNEGLAPFITMNEEYS